MHASNQAQRDVEAVARIAAVPRILDVITRTTGLRFAAVARVTDTRWIACAVRDEIEFGLQPGDELDLQTTICNEIRENRKPVVFGHASENPLFAEHPTPRLYGLESYISVPLHRANGEFFGTLCAVDPLPARVEAPETLQMMELFAELIGAQLESDEKRALSEAALHTALDVATLREDAIHTFSDDLKVPIQALVMDAYLLRTTPGLDAEALARIAGMEAHLWRMAALVGGIVDAGHDKLASGAPVVRTPATVLAGELHRALLQVMHAYPQRALVTAVRIDADVDCDAARLSQLLAHLARNVLRQTEADTTVSIEVVTTSDTLVLGVEAPDLALTGDELDSVAGPLTTRSGAADAPRAWDFFIAGEIARAHAGRIAVGPAPGGTRLSFSMPLRAAREGSATASASAAA